MGLVDKYIILSYYELLYAEVERFLNVNIFSRRQLDDPYVQQLSFPSALKLTSKNGKPMKILSLISLEIPSLTIKFAACGQGSGTRIMIPVTG